MPAGKVDFARLGARQSDVKVGGRASQKETSAHLFTREAWQVCRFRALPFRVTVLGYRHDKPLPRSIKEKPAARSMRAGELLGAGGRQRDGGSNAGAACNGRRRHICLARDVIPHRGLAPHLGGYTASRRGLHRKADVHRGPMGLTGHQCAKSWPVDGVLSAKNRHRNPALAQVSVRLTSAI